MEIVGNNPNSISPEYSLGSLNGSTNGATGASGSGVAAFSADGDTVLFSPMALTMSATDSLLKNSASWVQPFGVSRHSRLAPD